MPTKPMTRNRQYSNALRSMLLSIVMTLCVVGMSRADEPLSIEVSVSETAVTIGDVITYTERFIHQPDVDVNLPAMGANTGEFVMRDFSIDENTLEDGRQEIVRTYQLATYFTDERTIAPVTATFTTADGDEGEVSSAPLRVQVDSLTTEADNELQPLKDPRTIPPDYTELYRRIAMIAGGIAALGIIVYLLFRYLNRPREEEAPPPEPAEIVARRHLRELNELPRETLPEVKIIAFGLSELLRRYVGAVYRLNFPEMTTYEVEQELKRTTIDAQPFERLMTTLRALDLTKFADYQPTDEELDRSLAETGELIEDLLPELERQRMMAEAAAKQAQAKQASADHVRNEAGDTEQHDPYAFGMDLVRRPNPEAEPEPSDPSKYAPAGTSADTETRPEDTEPVGASVAAEDTSSPSTEEDQP